MLGTAQVLEQLEFPVDRLPFPLLPRLGHGYLCELAAVLSAHKVLGSKERFALSRALGTPNHLEHIDLT
jgi:hypothetical protein